MKNKKNFWAVFAAGLFSLILTVDAVAGSLSYRQRQALQRQAGTLVNIEKGLKKIETMTDQKEIARSLKRTEKNIRNVDADLAKQKNWPKDNKKYADFKKKLEASRVKALSIRTSVDEQKKELAAKAEKEKLAKAAEEKAHAEKLAADEKASKDADAKAAADKAAKEPNTPESKALVARSDVWKQVSSQGFKDADEVKSVFASLQGDKTLLAEVKKTHPDSVLVSDAEKSLADFEASLVSQKQKLKSKLEKEVAIRNRMSGRWESVANQAQASGTNVPQGMVMMYKKSTQLEPLKEQLGLYTALSQGDPAATKSARDFADQIKKVESIGVKMGAVDSAVTPRDSYSGGDKGSLKSKIEKAWASAYSSDDILGIHFIDDKWSRKTEKRYNNVLGWYLEDFSSMEVRVVLKKDKNTALIYPVYLTRDHLKGDALDIDTHTAKSNAFFKSEMLLKNYKAL